MEGEARLDIEGILTSRDELIRNIAYIQGQINQVASRQDNTLQRRESMKKELEVSRVRLSFSKAS
jgi:hypothetical protein